MGQSTNKGKEKKKIYKKLKNKFRLVIMNVESFEEKFSLVLSPFNVFTWGGVVFILLVAIVISVVAFTPLREFIPGYADVNTRLKATHAAMAADSLEQKLNANEKYLNNLQAILNDEPPLDEKPSAPSQTPNYKQIDLDVSKEDLQLRSDIEADDQYNLLSSEGNKSKFTTSSVFFFTPLKGLVSASFNLTEKHFGVDVIAAKNEAVKAALDGTVILATWTSETGHVIQLQHENNLVSIYKHNSVLLKKEGDHVLAGEAIAIIGESGELSTGPHLHFELWFNGTPIDPQNYMIF